MHETGFEGKVFTFMDPFKSFELFSAVLQGFINVLDLTDAFTFVIKALAFERFISLNGFSSVDFKA